MKRIATVFLLAMMVWGCKHPLKIYGEGDILSASGNRDCYYEWSIDPNHPMHTNCVDNGITPGDVYAETYTATPRTGWHFHRWVQPWCASIASNVCSWNIPSHITSQAGANQVLKPQFAIFRPDVETGFKSVFMGHSLFFYMGQFLTSLAHEVGFPDHEQSNYFFPGIEGAPISIWNNPTRKAIIQGKLDEGDIDVFGMAIHHDPSTQDIEGYRKWANYAINQNPDVRIFIGVPWLWFPHEYVDGEDYSNAFDAYHPPLVHGLIDQLRAEFPYTDFYCIPYGAASGDLWEEWDDSNLPDITALLEDPNNPDALWTDLRPHADEILVDLGRLVWLSAIYSIDVTTTTHDPGYITDLKTMANDIMVAHDPNYDAP